MSSANRPNPAVLQPPEPPLWVAAVTFTSQEALYAPSSVTAVITHVPSLLAVTLPSLSTVATDSLLLLQVSGCSAIPRKEAVIFSVTPLLTVIAAGVSIRPEA